MSNQEKQCVGGSRAEREQFFAEAEGSLALSGMFPTPLYHWLKARVLDGEITLDEARQQVDEHYATMAKEQSKPSGLWSELEQLSRNNAAGENDGK
jgi:hypothetical protein